MTPVIVTLADCYDMRGERYCSRGMRAFFSAHGLDWQQFRTEGLPADVIEATGDAMALQAAQNARARTERV